MKHTLAAFIFFTCLSSSLIGQSLNCKKFKNGTFKIPADSVAGETTIIRKGDKQTETIDKVDGSFEFIVKWLDDCTYTLTPTEKTFRWYPTLPKNAFLTVNIIEVKENSFLQTSSSNFDKKVQTFEVFKIK